MMHDYLKPDEARMLQWLKDTTGGIRASGPVPTPTTEEEKRQSLLYFLTLIGLAERSDISTITGTGIYRQTYIYRVSEKGRQEIQQLRGRA